MKPRVLVLLAHWIVWLVSSVLVQGRLLLELLLENSYLLLLPASPVLGLQVSHDSQHSSSCFIPEVFIQLPPIKKEDMTDVLPQLHLLTGIGLDDGVLSLFLLLVVFDHLQDFCHLSIFC